MDLYSFINSRAISKYLRDINYEFTTTEAAWLIFQCKSISLEEKHEAWKELIETMPDCELRKRMNCNYWESIHSLITSYISVEDKQYKLFCKPEAGAVYQYKFYCSGDNGWCKDYYRIFASADECWKLIDEDQDLGIQIVRICKRYIGSGNYIEVTFKPDKTALSVITNCLDSDDNAVINDSFEGLWFDFPVPFKKGDILIENRNPGPRNMYGESGPFVMLGITPGKDESGINGKLKDYGDNTDMNAWGYFQDDDGRIFNEVMNNYMDLDYYEGPFEGVNRLLVAISNYLKDDIGLDILLSAYRKITLDEFADDVMLHKWYPDTDLKAAGLRDVVEKNNAHFVDAGLNPEVEFDKLRSKKHTFVFEETYVWDNNKELLDKCFEIAGNYHQPKEMLYIYGDAGCGKTTLLQCIGNLSMQLSKRKLKYVTAENYMNDVIDAIKNGKTRELREQYRKLDFLIIDDLQYIAGKPSTTDEFYYMLNDVLTAGAQVVISADRPLEDLDFPDNVKKKLLQSTIMVMN